MLLFLCERIFWRNLLRTWSVNMWKMVKFMDGEFIAFVPSEDLWDIFAKNSKSGNRPNENFVLAQISDDAPFRWLEVIDDSTNQRF